MLTAPRRCPFLRHLVQRSWKSIHNPLFSCASQTGDFLGGFWAMTPGKESNCAPKGSRRRTGRGPPARLYRNRIVNPNWLFFSFLHIQRRGFLLLPQQVTSKPPLQGHDLQLTTGADVAGWQVLQTKALSRWGTHTSRAGCTFSVAGFCCHLPGQIIYYQWAEFTLFWRAPWPLVEQCSGLL